MSSQICPHEGLRPQSWLTLLAKLEQISPISVHGIKGLRPWSDFGKVVSWILSSRETMVRAFFNRIDFSELFLFFNRV